MGYGKDFSAVTDLSFSMKYLETEEEQELGLMESVARSLCQIAGGIWYAPNRGLDIRQFTADSLPQEVVKTLINNQVRLDERITECQTEIVIDDDGAWNVSVFPKPFDKDTPFQLVFKVAEGNISTIIRGNQ